MKRINFFYLVLSQKVDGKPNENTSFFWNPMYDHHWHYGGAMSMIIYQETFESVVRLVKTMMELDQEWFSKQKNFDK